MDNKDLARAAIEAHASGLIDLSHRIHELAETAFNEVQSASAVEGALLALDFDVVREAGNLPTALVGRYGNGSLNIGICAEYDALPGLGHACGHNLIAGAAVGAAAGLAAVADELDLTVTVFGTPAEEAGGGKTVMLQRGCFDGIHAAMMVHPYQAERDAMGTLANAQVRVTYTGRAAHAAAHPDQGINAASAMALAQVGIGMLREHIRSGDRVHGIVQHGGDAANIVPERTSGTWFIRSESIAEMVELKAKIFDIFKGAALMTGCRLEITQLAPIYADVRTHEGMAELWRANAAALGRNSLPLQPGDARASTDMGNVSYAVPTIHPLIAIEANGASTHEAGFALNAVNASADDAVVDGAIALAWTGIDIATNERLRSELTARAFKVADVPAGSDQYLDYEFENVFTFDSAE